MIRSNAGRCPISARCGIPGVVKSTYYWMLGHPETERVDPHEGDVERVWRDGGRVYGAGKIRTELRRGGIVMSRRRICRIMKAKGMASSYSRARYRPRPARPNDDPAPNLLAREFDGYKPRTHLASDPAYVRVGRQFVGVRLPARRPRQPRDRRPFGRRQTRPRTCAGRIRRAVLPVGCSTRIGATGSPGERVERMLDAFGITRSLSRPGTPYDNAVAESTNRLIKKELIYANTYTSVEQLRSDVNRYVWWYDHQRLHSTLGYLSPVEFTQQGNTL